MTAGQTCPDWPPVPTVLGHRGASALRPEHTLESYRLAIEGGADFIEPDLVPTRDGELVARHENAIAMLDAAGQVVEATTDVAGHPEFADRKTTKTIDGKSITGWFTEDFTLAELKTLRARERIPRLRPGNVAYNDRFAIPTLQQIIELAQAQSKATGRTIGIYPETKHPSYFRGLGLALEPRLLEVLRSNGWDDRAAPVFVQSFEPSSLRAVRANSTVRTAQLLAASGAPADAAHAGLPQPLTSYAAMTTPSGLREIACYAEAIGPAKELVLGQDGTPTALVGDAHAAGLLVHVWTLRPENAFLPDRFKAPPVTEPARHGDLRGELRALREIGVDGFFCDDPGQCRQLLDEQPR